MAVATGAAVMAVVATEEAKVVVAREVGSLAAG